MMDHAEFIRLNWHRRHEDAVRVWIRRSIIMLRTVRKNGMHKVWAHKPVTRP